MPSVSDGADCFGVKELMERTGLGRTTVYNWISEGLIESVCDDANQFTQSTVDQIAVLQRLMDTFRLLKTEIRNVVIAELTASEMARWKNCSDEQLARKLKKLGARA